MSKNGRAMLATTPSRLPGIVILLLGLTAGGAVFAEPPAAPGIGLAEAVRLMLEQDPNLAIGESRLRSSRGVLLVTRGPFDPLVNTSLSEE